MENVSQIFGVIMLSIAIWMMERILPSSLIMYLLSFLLIGSSIYLQPFSALEDNKPKAYNLIKLFGMILFLYGSLLFIGAVSGANNPLNPLEKFSSNKIINNTGQTKLDFEHIATLDELKAIINKSKKPIMVDFSADWCVSCKELSNITFKDDEVIKELVGYRLIKIDVTKNSDDDKKLLSFYNLFGPPALIFYEDGKEITSKRIIGYKSPKEFLKIIR
jgi:thiol:disulfide interchange protein DsbD